MPEVAVVTRVEPEQVTILRDRLRGLDNEASPFALDPPRTHFARFVVLDLGGPQLLFTSKFDGEQESYLSHVASVAVAHGIYDCCVEPPRPITQQTLYAYLLGALGASPVKSYVVPEQRPSDTVAQINEGIRLRAELMRFAQEAEGLGAHELAHQFRNLPSVRRLGAR